MKQLVPLLAFALAAGSVFAHDSWLTPSRDAVKPGEIRLEVSSGNRYPRQEFNPTAAALVRSACTTGTTATEMQLHPVREQATWMDVATDFNPVQPPLACWAQFKPFDVEMLPPIVQVYFAEIRAPAALRETWTQMQARNVTWHESYVKHMRIELAAAAQATPEQRAAARKPVGMELEMVVRGDRPIKAGEPVEFQVLRDGKPLAGMPIELVSARNPLGIWRETDGQGVVRYTLPFGGRWLLRGTDLHVSPESADQWKSRFVTLAIEAAQR